MLSLRLWPLVLHFSASWARVVQRPDQVALDDPVVVKSPYTIVKTLYVTYTITFDVD